MEEYNNEEFYENIYDVPEDDFNADEQNGDNAQEQSADPENENVQNEQNKEEDSKISIKDITELIKAINPEPTEQKEEAPVEEAPVEETPVEETPVEDNKEVKEIETHDYSEILNDIQREVSSGNAENQDAQQYIIDYIDSHSVYTPIDSISIDTLLLILILSALLTNILVNLIRRLF